MKSTATLLMCLLVSTSMLWAQDVFIIPAPVSVQTSTGLFSLQANTIISVPAKQPEAHQVAQYFVEQIKPATGYSLVINESTTGAIQFQLNSKADPKLGKEGYLLNVTATKVVIHANTTAGLFYGVQTLIQLLPHPIESKSLQAGISWTIPAVTITDYPRFAWRGMMLDVSRHFFPKEYIKDFIDQLARYKYNRFHWHLTDDNGWRVEIKSFPKLTEVGAWRVPRVGPFGNHLDPQPGEAPTYGGFYTQDDIREIVQYAKSRFIEVLPEIDVPGHSMALLAAYPELSVSKDPNIKVNPGTKFATWYGDGKFEMHVDNTLNPTDEKVYQFLDKVFTEIASLFPFEYIHMGGDECYHGYWTRDAQVQAFMKKNKIKDGEALQSYFVKRVAKIIESKKKKIIGWDEILEGGLAPGAAVMSWRGLKGGIEASKAKHPVVMSPAPLYYLDMRQGEPAVEARVYSDARLKDTYALEILAPGVDSAYVLGGQGNMWTENTSIQAHLEYMIYPRGFAVAESMWTPRHKKDWNSFVTRTEEHFNRADYANLNYAKSMYDPILTVKAQDKDNLLITMETEVEGLTLYYSLDNTIPNQHYNSYNNEIQIPPVVESFRVISYRDGKPIGRLITITKAELEKRAGK